jgi:UPF0755 protein
MKVTLKIGAIGFFIIGSIVFAKISYINAIQKPLDPNDDTRHLFKVESRETIKNIASRLYAENLIQSPKLFYWYVRQNNFDSKIQAGQFVLKKNQSIVELTNILTQAESGEIAITIIEGWTIKNIDTKLSELNLIKKGEFITCSQTCKFDTYGFLAETDSLEGYLFPDTYFINKNTFTPETFMQRLLDNFDKKITEMPPPNAPADKYTLNDRVKMASIIEKEAKTDDDRAIVSGILWKRLDNNWTLGADATLLYGKNDLIISIEDLENDSPYNTRKNLGLPKTAIANPGIKSLKAAFQPQPSKFWFYLTKPDTGEMIYAKTNEEHNINKQKYL